MSYALVNPYISVEELAEELKAAVPESGSETEDKYKRAIWRASRWVDEYTREDYFKYDHTVTPIELDQFSKGVYDARIFLPRKPVISIIELLVGETVLDDETEYRVDAEAGIIYSLIGDWAPRRPGATIKIYGTFGYAQASSSAVPTGLPGKVVIATRLIAAVYTGDAKKELYGLDGQINEIATVEIPKQVFQILGKQMPILT